MAPRVSLCMIVKDEEENLRRCLASVAGVVDEVVVVDTGSGDGTVRVAREFGAAVYTFPWNGSFGDARNASLEPATGDWILFLDADEELARESGPVLRRLVANETVEGYFVKIVNYLGHEGWVEACPDLVFRLFRNRRDYRFRGAVHEQIADVILERNPGARYEVAEDLVILHYGYLDRQIREKDKKNRNLALIQDEVRRAPENPVLRYHYGVELYRAERYEEAAEELLRAAGACPPQAIYLPKLWRTVVLAYQAAGRYDEALRAVETALALFPDYADLYYYGGLLCLEQKHYGRAYEFFSRALALPGQPTHYAPFAGTQGFRTHYHLGRLAEAFLNEEEAMCHYVSSLRDNPAFTPALESIARLLRPRENPDYARSCLEQLCEFCTPRAHLLMGEILFRLAAYRLALEYLERGTAGREVPPEVLLWKIICLMQQERYLEALRLLDGFPPGHRLYPMARLNKILCFWFQGHRRKVRPLVDEFLSLGVSPETGAVLRLLGDSLGRRKGPSIVLGEEGMALLLEIILRALDLEKKELVLALLACLSGECRQKYARAIGELFHRYGYREEAEHYLRLDLQAHGPSAATLYLLGELKERQGAHLEAQDYFRRALDQEPEEPRHYVKLIRVYEAMRREIWRTAAERYPTVFREADCPP